MAYQSEAAVEAQFVERLNDQDYFSVSIPTVMPCWLIAKSHLKLAREQKAEIWFVPY